MVVDGRGRSCERFVLLIVGVWSDHVGDTESRYATISRSRESRIDRVAAEGASITEAGDLHPRLVRIRVYVCCCRCVSHCCSRWVHFRFEIMSSCWLVEPHNRPTFSQLVMMLERLDGGSYSSNVDDPDGYENMSPMSKTSSVSYNRDTLDERETLLSPTGYTIMNLDSSPRPRMKDPTVTSPDDSDNYLPMLLKSATLTDEDQAFVTAPEEEEGGNYLPMSLKSPTSSDDKQNAIKSPERVDDYVSRTDGHETATKRQRTVSTASGKERKEVDATGDDEYMRMSVNLARADVSKPDVVEEQDADEYMRMTVQNGKRDVNRESGDADDKYVRMTSKSDLTTNGFANGKVGSVVNDDGEGTLL